MNRATTLASLALASALLTPVVVMGAGTGTTSAPASTVSATTAPQAQAATPASGLGEACARPVKVIYAGYGEGQGSRCAAEAKR